LFRDFNLKIEPGTTNAIIGPSGFGKTTLFNLLFRIYDPTEGRVLIDGQDIKDLTFESFRKYISIIP
jgi:ATP-binding cassette subfamily B protein